MYWTDIIYISKFTIIKNNVKSIINLILTNILEIISPDVLFYFMFFIYDSILFTESNIFIKIKKTP